ncbi:hypothetical protein, partial [Chromobacterium piscinae]|uniref:hypothetical protein n=1 Tax=Chromobacterium piscinae TaxID=686831 RepID=UPI00326171BC
NNGKADMLNLAKSILIVIFIALFQLSIYGFFVRPSITTWGATEKEISMPMAGDNKDLLVTATRAITINTSKAEVWKWLIQLGADRGGFYSYSFIEEALGYETRYQNAITPEFKEIKVGDLVRGSINEKHSIVPYSFKVLYVKPEESIVLDKWGTFLLKSISDEQTRLIVRSQEVLEIPFHFIMERRLLMGIKARAEAGESVKLSQAKDIIWFSGVVISGFLICWFVYIAIGVVQSIVISSILSFFWMCSIWLVDPIPLYSVSMVLVVFIAIWVMIRSKRGGV